MRVRAPALPERVDEKSAATRGAPDRGAAPASITGRLRSRYLKRAHLLRRRRAAGANTRAPAVSINPRLIWATLSPN